jgi:transcriptional regulator with XRE-family HTH domain
MTQTELKYTFADHCSGALKFVSAATGVLVGYDPSERFHWESSTSDPVLNQVDYYSNAFDEVIGVVIVSTKLPLLPTHLWCPIYEMPGDPASPAAPAPPASVVAPPAVPETARLARRLRDVAGLPVADLAAMVGIGRRQFYNLLERGSASLETELRVQHLAAQLERLVHVVGENPDAVRSALLTPVGTPARSFYEVALAGEDSKLGESFEALLDRIERRGLRQVPRAVPPRRTGGSADAGRAREALESLPSLDLDAEAKGGD